MATPLTRSPKFEWKHHDIDELRKEYYEIGLTDFMTKHKTGRWSVFHWLWYIPEHLKVKKVRVYHNNAKKKLERLENTTKVARIYEQKMRDIQSPKYEWPWASYFLKT